MSFGAEVANLDDLAARRVAQPIVFLVAVFSTLLGVLYLLGLIGRLIVDGTVHSSSSLSVQMVSAIVAILWNLALLIMFVALRRCISGRKAVFADLAVVFMTLVCATSSINWFVQLTILPKIALGGDPTMIALIDVHSNRSITYAIEHLGWGLFFGIATIFIAMAINGGNLERWIRWLFFASGALSILHVVGIATTNPVIGDLGYLAWGVLLPIATILTAIRFRRD